MIKYTTITKKELKEKIKRTKGSVPVPSMITFCKIENEDLSKMNLAHVHFDNCSFKNVKFNKCFFERTIFTQCDLTDCSFEEANFYLTSFVTTSIEYCIFDKSILNNVDYIHTGLGWTSFKETAFNNVNFSEGSAAKCDFENAIFDRNCKVDWFAYVNLNLSTAKYPPKIPAICPEEGSFIGWKWASASENGNGDEYLVKLEIPADAKRVSGLSRKCRCNKAKVVGIYTMKGNLSKKTKVYSPLSSKKVCYEVGKMVYPDSFDEDRWTECSNGIHFYLNKEEILA